MHNNASQALTDSNAGSLFWVIIIPHSLRHKQLQTLQLITSDVWLLLLQFLCFGKIFFLSVFTNIDQRALDDKNNTV